MGWDGSGGREIQKGRGIFITANLHLEFIKLMIPAYCPTTPARLFFYKFCCHHAIPHLKHLPVTSNYIQPILSRNPASVPCSQAQTVYVIKLATDHLFNFTVHSFFFQSNQISQLSSNSRIILSTNWFYFFHHFLPEMFSFSFQLFQSYDGTHELLTNTYHTLKVVICEYQ